MAAADIHMFSPRNLETTCETRQKPKRWRIGLVEVSWHLAVVLGEG